MLQLQVIGNIGANAELRTENGNTFVTFKVAHNERWTSADGQQHDTTTWISCVLNGDAGKLLQYLVKGALVFVSGEPSVRTYHSQAQRCMVAGIDLRVRVINLVGGRADNFPPYLFDKDGVQHDVMKFYNVAGQADATLYDKNGDEYTTDTNGWVTRSIPKQEAAGEQEDAGVQPTESKSRRSRSNT